MPDTTPPSPSALTHIAIKCHDLDRSIAFYSRWCSLTVQHQRTDPSEDGKTTVRVAWMGHSKKDTFWIVLLEAPRQHARSSLFDHLGFDVASREAVDAIAEVARKEHLLHWPAEDHGGLVGYLCGILDPDGNVVEFSFGQKIP